MNYRPTFDEFAALAGESSVVPVYRQLIGDTLTPVSAFCKIQEGEWAFLFESVVGGERLGRYSFLGSGPFLRFQSWDRRVRIEMAGETGRPTLTELEHADPLRLLEEKIGAYRAPHLPGLPRFCGGAVGHAPYDSVGYRGSPPKPPAHHPPPPGPRFPLFHPPVAFYPPPPHEAARGPAPPH